MTPGNNRASYVLAGLAAAVFLANGAIMCLELTAGPLVARYLGQSLYTWTAIIGVVLGGMALGHLAGGRLADRFPSARLVGVLFLLCGACAAVIPVLNRLAGQWPLLIGLPWPARIFLHVALAFLLPAALLGTINPVMARRALALGLGTGETVGRIYAAAAAGSIAGTFLTGFVLVAYLGVTAIAWSLGLVLVLLGAAFCLAGGRAARGPADAGGDPGPLRRWVLPCATVFASNAAFMVLELAGSRLITQDFGHSVHTWTAILGIVLAGITVGNALGGRMADQRPPAQLLPLLFVLVAALCLSVPWTHEQLVGALRGAGLHRVTRLLLHTAGMLFLPSLLLGTIGPVVAKATLTLGCAPGRTMGRLYAAGALGSVAGAFLTGYWLVAWLWPAGTLLGLCAVLLVFALIHGPRAPLPRAACAACALLAAAVLVPTPVAATLRTSLHLPGSLGHFMIHEDHTQYSWLAVRERAAGLRELVLDNLVHTEVKLDDPKDLRFRFWWIYEGVMEKQDPAPAPVRMLMIGGGGYAYPRYTEFVRPGSHIEVAEIDPAVTRAAFAYFGLPEDTAIEPYDMDGRNHVEDLLRRGAEGSFDYVIGDSINRVSVPFQLTTVEFAEKVYRLLADDGIYLLNTTDRFDIGQFAGAVMHTHARVFPHIYACTTRPKSVTQRDTIIIVCTKQPLDMDDVPGRIRSVHPYHTGTLVTQEEVAELMARSGPTLLTDDYAPVDNLLARVGADFEHKDFEVLESKGHALMRAADSFSMANGQPPEQNLREAMAIFTESPEVRERLARILMGEKRLEEAEALCREAIKLAPYRPEAFTSLGDVLMRQGRTEEAAAAYEQAFELDSEDESIREKLIAAQQQMRLVPNLR